METQGHRSNRKDSAMTGCIDWPYARDIKGYGKLFFLGKSWLAHRLAWAISNGSIPDELCVLHHCDNPPCINVEHLFLGTRADNNADRDSKGHFNANIGLNMAKHPERRAWGERQGSAKLTAEQVKEIRALSKLGLSQRHLGRRFGVGKTAIGEIIRGETWRPRDINEIERILR